jgi:hypothetical protein
MRAFAKVARAALDEVEHARDIVSAARRHRHGYNKDPNKLLRDAVDAYEAALADGGSSGGQTGGQ